jgi:hypothetical protein
VNETTKTHSGKSDRGLQQRIRLLRRVWLTHRDCLPLGWVGSLLTCFGGALTTNAWTALSGGVAPASFVTRVGVSYVGAATVVALLFPLMPTGIGALAKCLRRKCTGKTSRSPERH